MSSVRAFDSRLRELEERSSDPRGPRRWRRRFHPFMIHDLSKMLSREPGDPVAILVLSSFLRDDMPWLYELGMEAYHTAKRGSREQTRRALERFHRAFDMMERGGPFMEDSEFDHKMLHMLAREVEHLMLRPPYREEAAPPSH